MTVVSKKAMMKNVILLNPHTSITWKRTIPPWNTSSKHPGEKSHGRQEEIFCQKEVKLCFSFWLPKQYPSLYTNFLRRTVTFPYLTQAYIGKINTSVTYVHRYNTLIHIYSIYNFVFGLLTSVRSGSASRKQTTAMTRTSSSLACGLLRWRGNMSVMDVARLSTHTNCEYSAKTA